MHKSIKYGIIFCLTTIMFSLGLVFISKIYLSQKRQDLIQQNLDDGKQNNEIILDEDKLDNNKQENINDQNNKNDENINSDKNETNDKLNQENNNTNNKPNEIEENKNQINDNKHENNSSQNNETTKPNNTNKPNDPPKYEEITSDSKEEDAINNPNEITKQRISLKKYINKYDFAKQTTRYQDYFNKRQLLFDPIRIKNNIYKLIEQAILRTSTYSEETMSLKIKIGFNLIKNYTKVHLLVEWSTKLKNIGFNVIKNYYDIITISL